MPKTLRTKSVRLEHYPGLEDLKQLRKAADQLERATVAFDPPLNQRGVDVIPHKFYGLFDNIFPDNLSASIKNTWFTSSITVIHPYWDDLRGLEAAIAIDLAILFWVDHHAA